MKPAVEQIADAVLYEGYILYPYRPSAVKNRQRWNFGGICPQAYAEAQGGSEPWRSQTEVLARASPSSEIAVKLRFLHLVAREVAQLVNPVEHPEDCEGSDFNIVPSLMVGQRLIQTWQEALEREVDVPFSALEQSTAQPSVFKFAFPSSRSTEPVRGEDGRIVALLIRSQQEIRGSLEISAACLRDSLFRVRVELSNLTPFDPAGAGRDRAMMFSLASSHLILSVRDGEFFSLLDPPEHFAQAAAECRNIGFYPILVGQEGDRSTVLASPVILYDYPKIAPESAGDLFDGTEIDEILTLRIMALTDQEKAEMRQCDERARHILDRVEADPQHLARLHGTLRNVSSPETGKKDSP